MARQRRTERAVLQNPEGVRLTHQPDPRAELTGEEQPTDRVARLPGGDQSADQGAQHGGQGDDGEGVEPGLRVTSRRPGEDQGPVRCERRRQANMDQARRLAVGAIMAWSPTLPGEAPREPSSVSAARADRGGSADFPDPFGHVCEATSLDPCTSKPRPSR